MLPVMSPAASRTFALADPTRRALLARLALGEANVTELARPFDMSQPAISRHLGKSGVQVLHVLSII
jgi:DNA-binding transcriptional ArsR family regulator